MFYIKQQLGYLDAIPTGQISQGIRQMQTDNGEGTALCIAKKDTQMSLTILQYDSKGTITFTGHTWEIQSSQLIMEVQKVHENCWRLEGNNGGVLQIDSVVGGDIYMCITNNNHPKDLPFKVPSFSQIMSGGKSLTLRTALVKLVRQLREEEALITKKANPTYYEFIECLYDAMVL